MNDASPSVYEELEVQAPQRFDLVGTNWLALLKAGAISVVGSFICWLAFLFFYGSIHDDRSQYGFYLLTVIPWIAGAIYLGAVLRHQWAMHGMIYSFVPLLTLAISLVFKLPDAYYPLVIDVVMAQFFSVIITFFTMAMTRLLVNVFDK